MTRSSAIRFNLEFPIAAPDQPDEWAGESALGEFALVAEESGFDSIGAIEHPFPPAAWMVQGGHHALDPFVSLSFMAAATRRIRLLTFVMVMAYRNPYLAAKSIASLDLLSSGRLTIGTAAGYLESEFAVLGGEFRNRGARMDEALRVMKAAWSGEVVNIESRWYPAPGHVMRPLPHQRPHPPIWIGGNSRAASERAARLAQGWLPIEQTEGLSKISGTPLIASLAELGERIDEIRQLRHSAGRGDEPFDVCYSTLRRARSSEEYADRLGTHLAQYAAAGVTWITVRPRELHRAPLLQELRMFGERLIAPARLAQP